MMQGERPDYLTVLRQVEISLNSSDFPPFKLKPLQVKFLEYILKGQNVIGILPTGFGNSLMFHLLQYFLLGKKTRKYYNCRVPFEFNNRGSFESFE